MAKRTITQKYIRDYLWQHLLLASEYLELCSWADKHDSKQKAKHFMTMAKHHNKMFYDLTSSNLVTRIHLLKCLSRYKRLLRARVRMEQWQGR